MSKKLPTKRDVRLILAEDVRQELMGKASLQGFMPGAEFFVGGDLAPGTPPNVAFVLPSLAFLFEIIGAGEGKFDGRYKAIAPDKKTVIFDTAVVAPIEKSAGKATIVGTVAKPFIGPAFGIYTVQLVLDKAKFSFPMTIGKAPFPTTIGKGPSNRRSKA
jgi:hypothetical protein